MVSWCFLALSSSAKLLEVGTGEGKSCIIAMFAAMRVLMGEKVDIVSSSSELCKRDAEDWKEFYSYFNITVDVNTTQTTDEDRFECYKSDIVYGTVEAFAADHLRQSFELKKIRPDRQFQCIIVDKVDSLLLDQGVQFTYLSSDMVSMQHLNTVLAMIWSAVSQHGYVATESKVFIRGPPLPFYMGVYDSLDTKELKIEDSIDVLMIAEELGLVPSGFTQSIETIEEKEKDNLGKQLKIITQEQMLTFFEKVEEYLPYHFSAYIQDENGILRLQTQGNSEEDPGIPFLVLEDGLCCALCDSDQHLWEPIGNYVRDHLQFTPCVDDNSKHSIPGFLHNLVETKLEVWVQNAFLAIKLQPGREYIVKQDQILPVDFKSTGIVEQNKKWGDGLQQFLEMKHHTKLSTMSTITNFISNVAYFNKYQGKIYGTTGTLGTEADIKFLKTLYPNLSVCRIPSFNTKKLFEVKGEIEGSPDEWRRKICLAVKNQISPTSYGKGRAALVICESINRAKEVCTELKKQLNCEPKLYTRSDNDNTSITNNDLNPGEVIVATNLAGRGTDIKTTDEVNRSGGLFVVLTFLSQNARVERQAFGRTARKGQPGSAQLIVCRSHLQETLRKAPSLDAVKELRDHLAETKVQHVLEDDIPEVLLREKLFFKYCEILLSVYQELRNVRDQKVIVSILNEYWGIWLQLKSKQILELKQTELLTSLDVDIRNAKLQSEKNESPSSSVYHYIKFATKPCLTTI
ncbi:protein translocase subunit SecA-like [Acipenser ruthenus]|uniref:protein translocase subunit SecA-like n=1 Tax=Acipenser ruthenus TaxID=7906 RepID=UPI002740E0A7|nr:protein translocase subunit SecA-like [Acipenser ruthenus]